MMSDALRAVWKRLVKNGTSPMQAHYEIGHLQAGTVSARTCPGLTALGILNLDSPEVSALKAKLDEFNDQPDDFDAREILPPQFSTYLPEPTEAQKEAKKIMDRFIQENKKAVCLVLKDSGEQELPAPQFVTVQPSMSSAPVAVPAPQILSTHHARRKAQPLARGCLDYFPDALLAVAELSRIANEQHNPGEPLHWAKEKSTDHADCVARHLLERGQLDSTTGLSHTVSVAWRALALLQTEIEQARKAGS